MKFLKVLAISLLSFLLFLSLTIFGLALTLNSTILNPNFITSELDKLDVSSLTEELIREQAPEEEFGAALVNTITKLEPLIKEQVSAAIYPIYDYLLGESEDLNLALTLRNTFLTQDFIASLVDELDISSLASEFVNEQLLEEIPEEIEFLAEHLDDAIAELEPTIKEELIAAADPILDYLLGESQSISIIISLEPIIEDLEDTLREAFLESPPAELAGLPLDEIEQYFDDSYQEFSEQIPSTFELDETLFGTEIPAQLAEALAEAEGVLEQGKEIIGYFQTGYKALIGLILLLILCIILINRQVRGTTRRLGITFLTYGVLEYAGIFVAKHFAGTQLPLPEMPSSLQAWLPQVVSDFLAPLQWFSLGLLIGGVALLVVSFVYKPRQTSS